MTTPLGRIEALDDSKPTLAELTAEEHKRLRRFYAQPDWDGSLVPGMLNGGCVGMLTFVICFGLWYILAPVDDPQLHRPYFLWFAGAVGLYVAIAFIRSIGWADTKAREIRQDIESGNAHVVELDLERAVEIEEYEDEGAGFFLEMSDGRVLCLISQDLYDYATDIDIEKGGEDLRDQFPQTRIRYRYAPQSGICLDLTGVGKPLRPFGKVKTTGRFFKNRTYTGPEDGMVYEGPLEATLATFGYKLRNL